MSRKGRGGFFFGFCSDFVQKTSPGEARCGTKGLGMKMRWGPGMMFEIEL